MRTPTNSIGQEDSIQAKAQANRISALFKGCLTVLLAVSMLNAPVSANNAANLNQVKTTAAAVKMPDTPFLPPYSGRIISSQVVSHRQPDGQLVYTIGLTTAEQPSQVINWYNAALQNYGWSADAPTDGQMGLSAHHGTNISATITLMEAKKNSGAGCYITLSFRFYGQ